MLKTILIKTAELINRDDITLNLKKINTIEEINNQNTITDIYKMISYCNYVLNDIFENYINLNTTELLSSDENNRIYYSKFKYTPSKIITLKTQNHTNSIFSINTTFISTNAPNQNYIINYDYLPNKLNEFNDCLELPFNFNTKIICYGIASEFLASKDQFEKSDFWKNRYLYEIFKLKIKKERRLKSTFCK